MMIWLILAHVYNSLGNKEDFVIFKTIILMQARLNLQNVCNSLGNNDSFDKNNENTLRFKGT